MSYYGKRGNLVVNGLEWNCRGQEKNTCVMEQTVCEPRDGMGSTGQEMGLETVGKKTDSGVVNTRGGNKTPCGGTLDGGNRNQGREQSGNRGRRRNITRFPVPVPTTFSRPDLYRACPWRSFVQCRSSSSTLDRGSGVLGCRNAIRRHFVFVRYVRTYT